MAVRPRFKFKVGASAQSRRSRERFLQLDDIVEHVLMREIKGRDADGQRRSAYIEDLLFGQLD